MQQVHRDLIYHELRTTLRVHRILQNRSEEFIADKLCLSYSQCLEIERGEQLLTLDQLVKWIDALNINASDEPWNEMVHWLGNQNYVPNFFKRISDQWGEAKLTEKRFFPLQIVESAPKISGEVVNLQESVSRLSVDREGLSPERKAHLVWVKRSIEMEILCETPAARHARLVDAGCHSIADIGPDLSHDGRRS